MPRNPVLGHPESVMANNLATLSNDLTEAVARASASLVAVHARRRIGTSGVVWRPGTILTTSEGIRSEDRIRILFPDGRTGDAKLRGRDPGTDLALLDADTGSIPADDFIPDDGLKVGQIALAVGRTADTGPIASLGVVSGVAGEWRAWRGGNITPFVRLDVSVYPTSSGGAVVDASGHLFGLVSTGLSRTSVLALTRTTIHRVAQQLYDKGYVGRGFLGIALQPVRIPDDLRKSLEIEQTTGIMLLGVEPNGPAVAAGLTIGDVLVSAAGRDLIDPDVLAHVLEGAKIGESVQFRVIRGGTIRTMDVKIGERPVKG
jgi:S1-C subfamily serine protease